MKNEKHYSISETQYKIDEYLDKSEKGAFLNNEIITKLISYARSLEPDFYKLIAICIMPNHIHLLVKQYKSIGQIMKSFKGGSARLINILLNKSGTLWERDYFDKAIRDEKHFQTTYNYIKNNPIKAELMDSDSRFYGIYDLVG